MQLLLASAVRADAGTSLSVTITEPTEGAVVAQGGASTLQIAGDVAFDTPTPTERTYYAGRYGNPGRLTLEPNGESVGNQATESVTPLNELAQERTSSTYMTYAVDREPFTMDADRSLTGVVSHRSLHGVDGSPVQVGLGFTEIDVSVEAEAIGGEWRTLGTATVEYVVTPSLENYETSWTADVADEFDKADFTGNVTLTLVVRGYHALHGWTVPDDTNVTVPIYSASFARAVEVTVDGEQASAEPPVVADGSATWSVEVPMPAVGNHEIEARATQGWRTDASGFTVPRTSPPVTRSVTIIE